MKINAYVLAADPTWIRTSVSAYYDHVERIVVSYDRDGIGWTGAPVAVDLCLEALREIDTHGKMLFAPGCFHKEGLTPLEADTAQRRQALALASPEAEWVLQIDTDEVLPDFATLQWMLSEASRLDIPAVEWPMQVLYRRLRSGTYLRVVASDSSDRFEYPGPIAVRPGSELIEARRTPGKFLRPVVRGDAQSLQLQTAPSAAEVRIDELPAEAAIWHNSWAREPARVRAKINSWGHSQGIRSLIYFALVWRPSTLTWRVLRNFHPDVRRLWPRLAPTPHLPFEIHPAESGGAPS